ncbi:hypothetical protein [Dyella acidisoli]|uniref:Class IIb bacteriocin, lactobin A/cerein 7B family n=1 Tax=Dyella acidisoli TaxID=1867834 RepID=A0ABQ5XMD2_9GAMM|nr:hypothetical protein [Dyella acidisoli]GLQ91579.1 hypothetical protein GCM10007901_05290 [Dyella acidisoli]
MNDMIEMTEIEVEEVSGGLPEPSVLGFIAYLATGYINGVKF